MRIWTTWRREKEEGELLRAGTRGHEILWGKEGADMAGAEVAVGQPDPVKIMAAESVKWVHVATAGYTMFDRADFWEAMRGRGGVVTNSSHVFDEPCAQHLLAMMMGLTRGLPWALEHQVRGEGWRMDDLRERSVLINGQKVAIFGYGAIGKRLVELLGPLKMEIVGVRRRPRGDEGVRVVSVEASAEVLGWADHVVDILPASASTEKFFGAEKFAAMRRGARFYNIGRGQTVEQGALIAALESGQVSGAYLDVTDPEPLPKEDALWRAKNCFITPHSGGGFVGEVRRMVEHFLGNLGRYERGEEMENRVL